MTKVGRRVVADGGWHEIACAVRESGESPAGTFLDALLAGTWDPDPDAATLPDDEQVRDGARFLAWIEFWAERGYHPGPRDSINALDDGIWEFKRGRKRLTFYDTDGNGGYTPKVRYQFRDQSEYPESDTWFVPDMDELIRLGHAFPKTTDKTERFDLNEASQVREEDLQYDYTPD